MKKLSEVAEEVRNDIMLRVFSSHTDGENKKWAYGILRKLKKHGEEEFKNGVIAGLELARTVCFNQVGAVIMEANGECKCLRSKICS